MSCVMCFFFLCWFYFSFHFDVDFLDVLFVKKFFFLQFSISFIPDTNDLIILFVFIVYDCRAVVVTDICWAVGLSILNSFLLHFFFFSSVCCFINGRWIYNKWRCLICSAQQDISLLAFNYLCVATKLRIFKTKLRCTLIQVIVSHSTINERTRVSVWAEHQVSCFRARFGALILNTHTETVYKLKWFIDSNALKSMETKKKLVQKYKTELLKVHSTNSHLRVLLCESHCEWMSAVYFGRAKFRYLFIALYLCI